MFVSIDADEEDFELIDNELTRFAEELSDKEQLIDKLR